MREGLQFAPAAITPERVRHYARYGFQSEVTIGALMARNLAEFGRLTAVIDGLVELNWAELIDAGARFGGFLASADVGPGDVVMWQLPNWWETLVVAYGIWAAGAISNPIVPMYREHELRQVVEAVRPRCVVTAGEFRSCDHVALVSDACRHVGWRPAVQVVVRGKAPQWTSFDDTGTALPYVSDSVDPDRPALVGFTSGTTSGAKGVVHSSRSFLSSPLRSARASSYGWDDRCYMPATVAHATGVLGAIAIPVFTGSSVVLRDHWDAEQAVDDMLTMGITFSAGAAVFMQDILGVLEARGLGRLPLSSGYPCGGSNIPTSLAAAADAVGMQPCRSYGMTECPAVSASRSFDPPAVRVATDGWIAPGCEVRVLDPQGTTVGPGGTGEFVIRGPQRAVGYIDPAHTIEGFDDQGWFFTGDLGYVDADGTLTVTGRVKEIINRGGEKISGREIEDALLGHPAVLEAAVVPAPHERLGEQPAAFVLSRPGSSAGEAELSDFLRSAGLATQKIPRVWRFVEELPRTPSGKVKKYILQAELAAGLPAH